MAKLQNDGIETYLFCDNEKQINRLKEIFAEINAKIDLKGIPVSLQKGFLDQDLRIACYTDHEIFERYLWTNELADLADVDLVVRTSGEYRVSNFLLWQSAYAEYIFIEKCWPDFAPVDLRRAIETYSGRDRRFGAVPPSSSVSALT